MRKAERGETLHSYMAMLSDQDLRWSGSPWVMRLKFASS